MQISSDLFLQAITNHAIIMVNQHGTILSCNRAANNITGFTNSELCQQPFSIIYTDDDKTRRRSDDDLSAAVKFGRLKIESWKAKRDGGRYWAEMSISPVYNEEELIGYTVIIEDRTEQKREVLEVRQQEERYRLMVEGVRDYGIFMLDPTGHIVTWNDGAKRIKGYSADEILGKHFSTFYPRQDIESRKPERELEIAIATGKYEEEGWRVRKNGSLFWSNIVITTLYNEYNELIGFSKVTRDLSERKNEEESLRQSEERYRLLVAQVKDYGIFMLDDKGRIISWNEGARRMKGYEEKEIVGKYFSIFYPEEDKLNQRPAHELKIARAQGKYEEEGWRVRKDGTMFWANVIITSVYNENGIFLGFAKVTRDLTERRVSEIQLKETSEKFRILANKLKIVNSSLASANKELEQFTSIVSHDLQEPIRTIKSFLVLIEKKLSEPNPNVEEIYSYLNKAVKGSNRMKELIQNLLQYAQLSKDEVKNEIIDVNEMVSEVLQNLRSMIESSSATITITTETDLIKGDKIQLMQLLQNLITNSLKFVNGKKPEIKIHVRNVNDHVLFSVTDNGIGIAKDSQQKVFEIFRREHAAKDYPGTGIGLSICKKIVDRHNGKIWPESEPGKGTTFYFTLNDNNVVI